MRAVPLTDGVMVSPSWRKGALLGAAVAANGAVAAGLIGGKVVVAVLLALIPALIMVIGGLLSGHRAVLAYAALALNFTNVSFLNDPLPLSGGSRCSSQT